MDKSQTNEILQPEQNARVNQHFTKPLWITFAVLGVAILGLGIANAVVAFLPKTPKKTVETSPQTVQEIAKQTNTQRLGPTRAPIEELNEEEAIDAVLDSYKKGYTPEGLLDMTLIFDDIYTLYRLGYSYDDPNNITADNNFHTSDQYIGTDLKIEPTDCGYVLVTSESSEGEAAQYDVKYLGYAFDEKLLDYRPAEDGETTTEALSSENLVFNTNGAHLEFGDTSFNFIRKALPMVVIAAGPMTPGIMSVYDYEFEENDDEVTLTLYYLSPEADYESLQEALAGNVDYIIAGYEVKCTVNTDTGEFAWVTDDEGVVPQKVVSIPLSKENVTRIQEAVQSIRGL